ncbi:MAG TPA: aromatic ring-hydroxylating dioxygenase subunit alpha [Myxococcales bacterium]|nr:aromatic ring-hydroxylating dioxygenase subunit alpha [Myxococcales bacterium]
MRGLEPEIEKSGTLPAELVHDPARHQLSRERVFARSWQFAGDEGSMVPGPGTAHPFTLLPGCLDEPLYLARDRDGRLHCRSNACTHRGNLVVEAPCQAEVLRCRYHGRRFRLDGTFLSMPEFEGVQGFPSEADHLPRVELASLGKLLFASLAPRVPLEAVLAPLRPRLDALPLSRAALDPSTVRHYEVNASWILYCDNYLEGFHIPYAHPSLAKEISYSDYRTELFPGASIQVATAPPGGEAFDLPEGSPDHGRRIAAYYLWLFPNTMLNLYPWGISVNVVTPLSVDRTRVTFLSYVWDQARRESGAGTGLVQVEQEDEQLVESVQRGTRSRLYRGGRYSASRETGVHHFHRMLVEALAAP